MEGPIQDDDALFLFAIIRSMEIRRILEIGGLSGYSATNFLKAFREPSQSVVYTVDRKPVPKIADNHQVIVKDARYITMQDIGNQPLDMIFFDCHDYYVQMAIYNNFVKNGIITNKTLLVLHDTDTIKVKPDELPHSKKRKYWNKRERLLHDYSLPPDKKNGEYLECAHQPVERDMVNKLTSLGYHPFSLHGIKQNITSKKPYTYGTTVMQKFKKLPLPKQYLRIRKRTMWLKKNAYFLYKPLRKIYKKIQKK
ncbi:MAG: class I SAM-dependent methyltransferase [Alphaproteobacteria bacterium]